jgi:DNA (cytosine-5)-methyltransferase 1
VPTAQLRPTISCRRSRESHVQAAHPTLLQALSSLPHVTKSSVVSIPPASDDVTLRAFARRGVSYGKSLPTPATVQVIDFFAGCGGVSWGFSNTRQSHVAFDVLAGIDIDDQALTTYELNNPGRALRIDVRDIAERPDRLRELVPEFDPTKRPFVFVGCPPCQGFSAHRKKDDRDDERNDLVLAFARIVTHYRPDVFAMENVPEMLQGRFEHYYRMACKVFDQAGYTIAEDVLDLSRFGVPQRRHRAVVVGSLSGSPSLPAPILDASEVRTVRDAISHLDPIRAGETDPLDPWHRSPDHIDRILRKIEQIPADGGDRRDLDDSAQLLCHSKVDAGRTPGFTDVYGRLYWDRPAVTITAKSSTPSCGRFLHPEQHRNISVREAAILQGFPQNFVFAGSFVNQYRQIGEAVPPSFARHLAWAILDQLRPTQRTLHIALRKVEGVRRPTTTSEPLVVDLFCGAGGLSLGFHAAGYTSAYALDTDEDAVATFTKNISSAARVGSVLDESVITSLAESVGDRRFVIAGGPPCQGFSQQRRGDDDDPRNNLVLAYSDLVARLPRKPEAIVLENVMYLDSPRGRHVLAAFKAELESMGYSVHRHDLNSAEFGVAQLRRRIVLVALHDGGLRYSGPSPLSGSRWVTVGEVMSGLATPGLAGLANHVAASESDLNQRRMAFVDMGRGRLAIPEHLQLACHRSYDGHLDVYGRLDWFGYARTITGGFDSASRGEYAHPFEHRSITAREAARLQGFPDWFEFVGNKAAVRRQIGNAVPPPMGYAIGLALKDAVWADRRG